MSDLFGKSSEIIREAARSPLGLLALVALLVGLLAATFFHSSPDSIKVSIFLIIILAAGIFVWKTFQIAQPRSSEEKNGETKIARTNRVTDAGAIDTARSRSTRRATILLDELLGRVKAGRPAVCTYSWAYRYLFEQEYEKWAQSYAEVLRQVFGWRRICEVSWGDSDRVPLIPSGEKGQ
ncbi:MAG: hypothetical protein GY854_20910 [Deltaproteobacteria bacterium]|nr:hypothetical protein [Deltaproteobacteria bacterium]